MFLSNLPKHICRNASFDLRSLGRADKDGIRLVLKLEFDPKNKTLQSKQRSFLKLILSN
jgi:hypothetical protein